MQTTVLLIAMLAAGAALAVQGVLTLLGRRQARASFFERPLVDLVAPKGGAEAQWVLGRLRLAYAFFLILAAMLAWFV